MPEDYLAQALNKDENTNFGDDDQINVLDNLTDEAEIAEAKKLIFEQVESERDTSTDNSKDSEPSKEEVTPQSEEEVQKAVSDAESKKEDNQAETKEADTLPEEGNQEKSGKFVLTDEVINSYPEEYRGVLSKYKGKDESEIIKALVNANKLISKRQEQSTVESKIETESKNEVIPDSDEVKSLLDAEIIKRLKTEYEDFPDTLDDLNFFLRDKFDEDPMKYNKVVSDVQGIKETVNNDYKRVLYLQNNYQQLNQESIKGDVDSIKKALSDDYGIANVDKLFDLELKQTKDNNGNTVYQNDLIESLLLDQNGQIDNNVVSYFGQVPVIRKNALADKFLKTRTKEILIAVRRDAEAKARSAHSSLVDEAPQTIGTQSGSNSSTKVIKLDQLSSNNDYDSIMATKQALEKQLGIN